MSGRSPISSTLRLWQWQSWIRAILLLVLVWVAVYLLIPGIDRQMLGGAIGTLSVLVLSTPWKDRRDELVRFLNQQVPDLEHSTQLLTERETSGLAKLQQSRISERINRIPLSRRMRDKAHVPLILLAIIALFGFRYLKPATSVVNITAEESFPFNSAGGNASPDEFAFLRNELRILPPVYTGLSDYQAIDSTINIPEGSLLNWKTQYSAPGATLLIRNADTSFYTSSNKFEETFSLERPSILSLTATSEKGEVLRTPLLQVNVIRDKAPNVSITDLDEYTSFNYDDRMILDFKVAINDDYGITDVKLIATVTSGEGESVQFREKTIQVPGAGKGKSQHLPMQWNLAPLALGPGDELYFHAEALDNNPTAGVGRSPTYFAQVRDTTDYLFSLEGDLGVDLMPEYFRSQRQIIIDTEKLIKDRPSVSKQEFSSRSNELGFDQKSLRLKYGQFIGIEDESGIAVQENPEDAPDEAADFYHNHDHEDEDTHNHEVEEADNHEGHDHGEEDDEERSPLEQFIHAHDSEEAATFFDLSLKAKLRAALSEMWDAELYLRLFQPEKSLPYQYRALRMIQEIKNDARVYVHRIGFSPPPIKEDTRLSGKTDGMTSAVRNSETNESRSFPQTRTAIAQLSSESWSESLKKSLTDSQQEITSSSLDRQEYFQALRLLSEAIPSESVSDEQLEKIRLALIACLPDELQSAQPKTTTQTSLQQQLLQPNE